MTDDVKGEMFPYHSQNRYEADADCSSKGCQGLSARLACSKGCSSKGGQGLSSRLACSKEYSSKGGQGLSAKLACSKASMEYLPNAPLLSRTSRETTEKDSGNALN